MRKTSKLSTLLALLALTLGTAGVARAAEDDEPVSSEGEDSAEEEAAPEEAAPPAKPAAPAAKPAEPAAKPAEPAAKPAEPAAKPAEPAAKPAEPAAAAEKPAAAKPAAKKGKTARSEAGEEEAAAAADLDLYGVSETDVPLGGRLDWAERRSIRVIQKRAVLKEGRHAFTLLGGVVPNDDFFAYITGGAAYNYFFSEDLAMELAGAYTYNQKTGLEGWLIKPRPKGPELDVRLPQVVDAYANASLIWNLLHGKLGFFETRLTEFDAGLVFGIGAILTTITDVGKAEQATKIDAAGNVGADLVFYLADRWAMRASYRQVFYPAEGGGVSFPIAITLGLTWFTEGAY